MADPLSLAANIAGLIALVGKVVEISQTLCSQVTPQQRFLQRLVEQVTDFHTVLDELSKRNSNGSATSAEEQNALRQVAARCEKTVVDLCARLNTLQTLFAKGMAQRLWSSGKIKAALRDVEDLRKDLALSKQTLTLALNLRIADNTENIPNSKVVEDLHTDIQKVQIQLQQLLLSQPEHPAEQYVKTASRASLDTHSLSGRTVVLSSSLESATKAALDEDLESMKLFDSFDSWIDSLSAEQGTSPSHDAVASTSDDPTEPPELGRHTKLELCITNLEDQIEGKPEVVHLSFHDYVQNAIDVLDRKGHHGICGFKLGKTAISPAGLLMDPVPVFVTSGPSSYSPDWFSVNVDEPLDAYYDDIFRSGYSRRNPLKIDVKNDCVEVVDTHSGESVTLSLSRTLRVPEDDHVYNQPMLFGRFPMVRVDSVQDNLPESFAQKGGVLVPVLPREAVAITMEDSQKMRPARYRNKPSRLAIRVLCGGINAVSHKQESEKPHSVKQDYIIAPAQRRLDGFNARTRQNSSVVRQFVAMSSHQGYTAEEQITGESAINGIQMIMAPKFISSMGLFCIDNIQDPIDYCQQKSTPRELSLEPGVRLVVYGKDKYQQQRHENFHRSISMELSRGQISDIRETYAQSVARFETKRFKFRQQLPKTKPKSQDCDEKAERLSLTCGHKFCNKRRQESTDHLQLAMRCSRFSESDVPFSSLLEVSAEIHLRLEAIFEVTVHLRLYDRVGPSRVKNLTYILSPLTPLHALLVHLVSCGVVCCQRDVSFILDNGGMLNLTGTLLDQGCIDGSILHVRKIEGARPILKNKNEMNFNFADSFTPSAWELGIAAGGYIYQLIYGDSNTRSWNWHKARHFNIQIMNAVAFKSFTGIEPPEPPMSFTQYVDAGLPFQQILQTAARLGGKADGHLATISTIDLWKGVSRDTKYTGPVPFLCLKCEKMLADSMFRPCNHILCRGCIKYAGPWNGHCVCGARSTHIIQFQGPMERPMVMNNTKRC